MRADSNEGYSLHYVDENQVMMDEEYLETSMRKHDDVPRKTVTFSSRGEQTKTLHLFDFTEEEILAYWYNPLELHEIRQDMSRTWRMMKEGNKIKMDSGKYCRRGIDSQCDSVTDGPKRKLIRRSVRAVLKEQNRQRRRMEQNDDVLAAVYMAASEASKQEAHNLGLQDEQESLRLQAAAARSNARDASPGAAIRKGRQQLQAGWQKMKIRLSRRKLMANGSLDEEE